MLGWTMTLEEFRTYLQENADYQAYCRERYTWANASLMHFTFAFLLNGTGKTTEVQKTYIKEVFTGGDQYDGPWAAGLKKFLEGKKTSGDMNPLFKKLDKHLTIYEAYREMLSWKDEEGQPIIGISKEKQLHELLDYLLKTTVQDEISILIRHGDCRQIIFTGAPGTGKTFIAKEVARELGTPLPNHQEPYEMVQFHPSMDYTDFVEGLRPIERNDKVSFAKVDGIFKAFCRKVEKENEKEENRKNRYFFIIDEINRANLSKVFGELMYCLEKDKRDSPIHTQYQNLPTYDLEENKPMENDVFKKDGFYIPGNVVILGTMNDIDRSVDSMDFAMRRRFEWKEFVVSQVSLERAFTLGKYCKAVQDSAKELAEHIMNLNEYIHTEGVQHGLNRQYDISQGQFANLPETENTLERVMWYAWDYRIESLLREYLRGEEDAEAFIEEAKERFFKKQTAAETEKS